MNPMVKLDVRGIAAVNGGSLFAASNSYLTAGALDIGDYERSYGGGTSQWSTNTAGLLLETLDNTEIAVHDSGSRVASLMYFEGGGTNRITIGRNMGWDAISTVAINGNVGIGTTNPTAKLQIANGALYISGNGTDPGNSVGLWLTDSGTYPTNLAGYSMQFLTGNNDTRTARITITNGGNVGIGTGSPSYALDVFGTIRSNPSNGEGFSVINDTIGRDLFIGKSSVGTVIGYCGTAAMVQGTISTLAGISDLSLQPYGSNVGIGTTSPGYKLHVNGTFYYSGSSIRYKENVKPLEVDASKIYLLNPVSFDFKKGYKDFGKTLAGGRQIGLIAEDVAKIIPELAIILDDQVSNVDYEKLSVLLLKAVKDLKTQNDMLRSTQNELALRIKALEERK